MREADTGFPTSGDGVPNQPPDGGLSPEQEEKARRELGIEEPPSLPLEAAPLPPEVDEMLNDLGWMEKPSQAPSNDSD